MIELCKKKSTLSELAAFWSVLEKQVLIIYKCFSKASVRMNRHCDRPDTDMVMVRIPVKFVLVAQDAAVNDILLTHAGDRWRGVCVIVFTCAQRRWRGETAPGLMMCSSRFTNEEARCLFPRTMPYWSANREHDSNALATLCPLLLAKHTHTHMHACRHHCGCIPDTMQVVVLWLPEHMCLVSPQFHEY